MACRASVPTGDLLRIAWPAGATSPAMGRTLFGRGAWVHPLEEDGSERSLRHDEILKARTVFTWTSEPKSARKKNDRSTEAAPGRKVRS